MSSNLRKRPATTADADPQPGIASNEQEREPEIQPADDGVVHYKETAAAKSASEAYQRAHGITKREPWLYCTWVTAFVVAVVGCLVLIRVLVKEDANVKKLFTTETLALYNGEGPNPYYIAILGQVFDVTKGKKYYGKGGGYECFVGRDASKAFITGAFEVDRTDDVSGLKNSEMLGLVGWRDFYHKKYVYKGRLVGRFYDASGSPTAVLKAVEEAAEKGRQEEAERAKHKEVYPPCHSEWSQDLGGWVWCDDGMYPRRIHEDDIQDGGPVRWRCACFKELGWSDLRQVYDDCDPDATRCRTSMPAITTAAAAS